MIYIFFGIKNYKVLCNNKSTKSIKPNSDIKKVIFLFKIRVYTFCNFIFCHHMR